MTQPTEELIIWANTDVNLPKLAGPNKTKPIDDLINKGWDFTEKPTADEFNYILNNICQWLKWAIDDLTSFENKFGANLGINGYQQLSSNIYFQWCSSEVIVPTEIGSMADVSVIFPLTFTTLFQVTVGCGLGSYDESGEMTYGILSQNNTRATARFMRRSGSNVNNMETTRGLFFAIGTI